jgi:peptide/nickel transport system permease protein
MIASLTIANGFWSSIFERLTNFFQHWATQDVLLVTGLGVITWLLVHAARSDRWRRAWLRFKSDRTGIGALIVVCIYLFIGALETFRIPNGEGGTRSLLDVAVGGIPSERSYSAPFSNRLLTDTNPQPDPLNSSAHVLGTDALGKDVFVQTLKACRTALIIGGFTSVIYIPLGALAGLFAGYFRKRVDDVIQYIYSTFASIPEILLLISIMFVLGPGLGSMSIALGVTGWVGLCRLIRGETMRQSERAYVAAARALGQSHWAIITRHLLPNVMHLVLINFVLGFSGIVLSEAILSYLGVGVPVGTASWGTMIDSGRSELSRDPAVWWNLTAASVALFGLVLALNLLGDALRRAFDPKRS